MSKKKLVQMDDNYAFDHVGYDAGYRDDDADYSGKTGKRHKAKSLSDKRRQSRASRDFRYPH